MRRAGWLKHTSSIAVGHVFMTILPMNLYPAPLLWKLGRFLPRGTEQPPLR